ncbi:MAG: type II toxin-antitoxin system RelE/ParE family toxin [Bacteroidota bacterium]|nr:type II toxin-antitoxin system RelE/ParE family toxin [Bacteroidota bacterium]
MTYDLRWTERAADDYEKLVDYLLEKWGLEITIKVTKEIDQTITHIRNAPEHFPILLPKKKIRRCVASPQTSIYFKADNGVVEILTLFDNRQNPKKLKL